MTGASSSASGWVHEKEIQARKVLSARQSHASAGDYVGDWKDKHLDAQYGVSDKVSHKVEADEMQGENILAAHTDKGKAMEKQRALNDEAHSELPKKGDTTKDNTEQADKTPRKGTIKEKDTPVEAAPLDTKDAGADKTDAFDDARDDSGNASMPHKTTGLLGGLLSGLATKLGLSPQTQTRELASTSVRDEAEWERQSRMLRDEKPAADKTDKTDKSEKSKDVKETSKPVVEREPTPGNDMDVSTARNTLQQRRSCMDACAALSSQF